MKGLTTMYVKFGVNPTHSLRAKEVNLEKYNLELQ